MSGPCFDVMLSLNPQADRTEVSRKISRIVSKHGLGVIFGAKLIACVFVKEGATLEKLAEKAKNPLIFSLDSSPLDTDLLTLFRSQLNPWFGARPADSDLLKVLTELWSLDEIDEADFVVWDMREPSPKMPRYNMTIEEFRDHMANFYPKQPSGTAEGIFHVSR